MKMKFVTATLLALSIALPAAADTVKVKRTKTTKRTVSTARVATTYANDLNRLQAILAQMNTRATLSGDAWKRVANEANMLANRVHARTRTAFRTKNAETRTNAVEAATQLRNHVRMMRSEAMEGDGVEAAKHAIEALPFAYRLEDWM